MDKHSFKGHIYSLLKCQTTGSEKNSYMYCKHIFVSRLKTDIQSFKRKTLVYCKSRKSLFFAMIIMTFVLFNSCVDSKL